MIQFPKRSLTAQTSWLTQKNINSILTDGNVPKEVDLLSVDIDGIDYWLWQAVEAINPRVVIMEYNASFGQNASVTIPYEKSFYRWDNNYDSNGWYYGASLAALTQLAEEKGYVLLACESTGVNVFFVRKDLVSDELPSQSVSQAFYPDKRRLAKANLDEQIKSVSRFQLVDVAKKA